MMNKSGSITILALHIVFIIFASLICIISVIILISSLILQRPTRLNLATCLACNSYSTMVVLSCCLVNIAVHSIYGYFYPSISFADRSCEILGYFSHVSFCAFYYSFVLQAIFRLFRIMFYKKKILQSFTIFIIAVGIQWLISFALILPSFLSNDFEYIPFEYHCWISFENIRAITLITLIIYGSPLVIVSAIYSFVLIYIRRSNPNQRRRHRICKRDGLMLKRITILLLLQVIISLPTVTIFVLYIITHNLILWVYPMHFIVISIILMVTSITLILCTSKIRNIFRRKRQILPMVTIRTNQPCMIETSAA